MGQLGPRLGRGQRTQLSTALRRGQRGGQLPQRQRVSLRLVEDVLGDRGSEAGQQRHGRPSVDAGDVYARQRPRSALRRGAAGGEEHDDAFVPQPPGGKGQCVRGRPVEPLQVVGQAQQGVVRGRLGQQRQCGEPQGETVPYGLVAQAEDGAQSPGLRSRQPVE